MKHDNATNYMSIKPHIIGLENIILSTAEANIFVPGTEQLYRQPDGLFFDYIHKKVYNVEYKTNKNITKARLQLLESGVILKKLFPRFEVINLYVHGDYVVERF